jgi:hypothetical protein
MSKRLPVPPELEHLVEKREQETDRRGQKRRSEPGDAKPASTGTKSSDSPPTKASGGVERRQSAERRQKKRRKRA